MRSEQQCSYTRFVAGCRVRRLFRIEDDREANASRSP
jgi:hypothetical protein